MSTENLNAGSSPGERGQAGLFAQPAAGTEANDHHAAPDEEAARPKAEHAEEAEAPAAAGAATHEVPSAAAEDGHDGDAAEGAAAAAQSAVDARAGGGHNTAEAPQPAAPLSPKTRILPDEDEPYSYPDCTVNINIQLLPDDGDGEGREVIVAVSSHIEGPLVELTRLNLLGPLPPLLAQLLKQHEERLPTLGAARDEQRQRTTSRAATPAKSKTTVRGVNGKATASKTAAAGSTGGATPSGPVAPVRGEQTALFDLMTGRRPKAEDDGDGNGNAKAEGAGVEAPDAEQAPPASGGE